MQITSVRVLLRARVGGVCVCVWAMVINFAVSLLIEYARVCDDDGVSLNVRRTFAVS